MQKKARFLTQLLLVLSLQGFGQIGIESLHYRERLFKPGQEFKDTITNHSSIFPRVSLISDKKSFLTFSPRTKNESINISISPLINLNTGIEINSLGTHHIIYDAGVGASISLNTTKLFLTGNILPYMTQSPFLRDSSQAIRNSDLGSTRAIANQTYVQNEWIFGYRPNHIFTFMAGNGRNFFGEGYRSLILSDNAGSTPFFKIETNLKSIKYVNLYQAWKDNTIDPANRSLDRRKFAAMHYISWNITREFNLSVFESVIWQENDTLINRGFDPNYLNPIVFYRPVEYNNGSADNVLLGANMSFKFNKFHAVYTQLLLDDFLLSEIRARSRWWANKYAFQFGYKSYKFVGIHDLYFQSELNIVRPFTYSHNSSIQSYGHLNAPLTHPIGANFYEVLGILAYKKFQQQWTGKITYTSYGVDTSTTSYGQDIFKPYGNRPGEYDQLIMQGLKKNVLNTAIIWERPLASKINLYFNATYNWRMEIRKSGVMNQHYFTVGIISRIWNQYSDY